MSSNRREYSLLDYFKSSYKNRFGNVTTINKHRHKWTMADIADDLGVDETKALIDFYMKTPGSDHSINRFYKIYDQLMQSKELYDADIARRKKQLLDTKRMIDNG